MAAVARLWPDLSSDPAQLTLAIIVAATGLRLVLAVITGLGNDESYSVANARDLGLSYLDHPPLHLWLAHFFDLEHSSLVRLPFVLIFAGTSWLLYRLTERLFDARSGLWAVIALSLSPFFTVEAGSWVLPDGPLIFCVLAGLLCLLPVLIDDESREGSVWLSWLGGGVWLGLASLSKYHAVFFAAGIFAFLLLTPGKRQRLRHPAPYAGLAVALLIFAPVLVWNAGHAWASFAFQGERAVPSYGFAPLRAISNALLELLYLGPWIALPAYSVLRSFGSSARERLCYWLGLPQIVFFTLIPLFGTNTMPHWAMPGWLMLFPLIGATLAREGEVRAGRWAKISGAVFGVLLLVLATDARTGWTTQVIPGGYARGGDPTLVVFNWNQLADALAQRGLLKNRDRFIATFRWDVAGKIDYALEGRLPVLVLSPNPHSYARHYEVRHNPQDFVGRDGLIMAPTYLVARCAAFLKTRFSSIAYLAPVYLGRGRNREIELQILYGRGLRNDDPAHPIVDAAHHPCR
ncbi:MAG: glycosyltransferase family 39 protein [Rhizomicrobium sp.]